MTDQSIQFTGALPAFRGLRPLKRWRYVGVFCADVMLCAGDVRVGPLPQRFWAVCEPGGALATRTTVRRGGVWLDGSRVAVRAGDVAVDLTLEEIDGIEATSGDAWTRKQAGARARGSVRVGERSYAIDCGAVVDDSAGYHPRHTQWRWSAGVGVAANGAHVGWNLVTGMHDGATGSERAVWVDGAASEVGPVRFADDLSSIAFDDGSALRFAKWAAREEDANMLLLRSRYRQPFGVFSGELPGGVSLREGFGVMEEHDVHW